MDPPLSHRRVQSEIAQNKNPIEGWKTRDEENFRRVTTSKRKEEKVPVSF